jgi:hypothetical protein
MSYNEGVSNFPHTVLSHCEYCLIVCKILKQNQKTLVPFIMIRDTSRQVINSVVQLYGRFPVDAGKSRRLRLRRAEAGRRAGGRNCFSPLCYVANHFAGFQKSRICFRNCIFYEFTIFCLKQREER